jgi:FixJ family two-component response regulator
MSEPATILVVDDTEANRRLLGDLLGVTGYKVLSAASGAEALALVRDERPDLVLLDVVMPGMSGYDDCVVGEPVGNLNVRGFLKPVPAFNLVSLRGSGDVAAGRGKPIAEGARVRDA